MTDTTDGPMEHLATRVPDGGWREVIEGDPSLLIVEPLFSLNGVMMHVEAIEVCDDDAYFQRGTSTQGERMLDHLAAAFEPDGGWQTTTINGREYVVFMEPYSR